MKARVRDCERKSKKSFSANVAERFRKEYPQKKKKKQPTMEYTAYNIGVLRK